MATRVRRTLAVEAARQRVAEAEARLAALTGGRTDGELADAILRKIANDDEACILVETTPRTTLGVIYAPWFCLTEAEAAYLTRLRAAAEVTAGQSR